MDNTTNNIESSALPEFIANTQFTKEKGLLWGGQCIGNFEPVVICEEDVSESDKTEPEAYVRLQCNFTDGTKSMEKSIPLSQLENYKWHDFDKKCQINPDCKKATKYLASIIRAALSFATVKKRLLITRPGMHFVNSKPLYCVGDRLILSPDIDKSINIEVDTAVGGLVVDNRLTEHQAVAGMMRIVNVSPEAGKVIFAQCLLGIMRSVYKDIGAIPRGVLFLVGESGTHKTIYSTFATQLYGRDDGIEEPKRFNSSIPALEAILNSNYDSVVVIDDLFPSEDRGIKRNQEKNLIELVRIVGDNVGRALVRGNEVVTKDPKCGLIVAGEYVIGSGSNAARLLTIIFKEPIDGIKLVKCQLEPLVLSTFYNYFITWFVENYFEIQEWLAGKLIESRKNRIGVHDRLQETYFHLDTAYQIFVKYCIEKKFTSPSKAKASYASYKEYLTSLITQQDGRVKMSNDDKSEKTDYLNLIRTLYRGGVFRLADTPLKFKGHKHHGLIFDDCVCLRGVKLIEEINKLGLGARLNDVAGELERQDALNKGHDKRSVQIPTPKNNYRFYAIPLKKLE